MADDVMYIHYLSRRPGGPIRSKRREVNQEGRTAVICEGGEYLVACQPGRRYLCRARITKRETKVLEFFLATGDPQMATCPKCLETKYYKEDFPTKGV